MYQFSEFSRKALFKAFSSLVLILLLSNSGLCQKPGEFSSPSGCTPPNCDYSFKWSLDSATDVITFTVTGKQAASTWVAVGFGLVTSMENQDTYYGYVDSSGVGTVNDAWVGSRYTPPAIDSSSSLISSNISYVNGVYTMIFSRARVSTDAQDVSFTDEANIYIKYPVGGGPMSGSTIQRHFNTPMISPSQICFCAAVGASTMAMGPASSQGMAEMTTGMGPMTTGMGPMNTGMETMGPASPSMGPASPSMGPASPSMGPASPSMGPSGSTMTPGGSPKPSGGSDSDRTKKVTLIATLVVFGCLAALVFFCWCCFMTGTAPATRSYY